MVRHVSPAVASPGDPPLFRLQRGDILALLPKGQAERGYHLYQDRRVVRITWTGDDLEAELSSPPCTGVQDVRQRFARQALYGKQVLQLALVVELWITHRISA